MRPSARAADPVRITAMMSGRARAHARMRSSMAARAAMCCTDVTPRACHAGATA
jgi:hypothetical protein